MKWYNRDRKKGVSKWDTPFAHFWAKPQNGGRKNSVLFWDWVRTTSRDTFPGAYGHFCLKLVDDEGSSKMRQPCMNRAPIYTKLLGRKTAGLSGVPAKNGPGATKKRPCGGKWRGIHGKGFFQKVLWKYLLAEVRKSLCNLKVVYASAATTDL